MNYKLAGLDRYKWLRNLAVFFIPVGILYLTTVVGVIESQGGIVGFDDFIPSQLAIGGMVLYVLNGILDYLRKVLQNG